VYLRPAPINDGAVPIDVVDVTEPLPGVAMVLQHFGLFPWKTVQQNVGYGLQMAGVEKAVIAEKVPHYINLVGLTGFEIAYPHQLSSGMQQRCGLARALASELPLGILMARLRLMRIGLDSYILGLYATPMAALILFILAIFGFQFWPKVIVVVLFSVFPILYNTLEGARSLKSEMLEVAKAFRSSERRIWADILIPYTLPFALTGIRQAIGRALVGMVAAEIFLNNTGLGGWLVDSSRSFDMAGVLGAIIVTTLIGVFLMSLVRRLEKRFAGWRGAAS